MPGALHWPRFPASVFEFGRSSWNDAHFCVPPPWRLRRVPRRHRRSIRGRRSYCRRTTTSRSCRAGSALRTATQRIASKWCCRKRGGKQRRRFRAQGRCPGPCGRLREANDTHVPLRSCASRNWRAGCYRRVRHWTGEYRTRRSQTAVAAAGVNRLPPP